LTIKTARKKTNSKNYEKK